MICGHTASDCVRSACGFDCPAFAGGRNCACDNCCDPNQMQFNINGQKRLDGTIPIILPPPRPLHHYVPTSSEEDKKE